jgi:pimeloyl-ACP methyl ester carboxylesterase
MADLRLGSMVAEREGEGPAVVLVHGLGGTSNSFQPLMPALDGFTALRPDLPGAGRSPRRPGLPGLDGLAVAVKDAMRLAGATRAHLVGHSMGTLICQHLAARNPGLALSLTLFGPILEPPVAARQAMRERAAAARRDGMAGIAEAVSRGSLSEASRSRNPAATAFVRESLMRQDPAGYAAHCEALAEARAADHAAILCPTLLVAGGADPVAPVAMARDLAARIAGARTEVLPEVGHWMTIEEPRRSGELLRAHIEAATQNTAAVAG